MKTPAERSAEQAAAAALLAAAAGTLSFASHAAALPGLEATAIANDLVHTLAAAVWSGGLVALFATARRVRALPEARRGPVLAEALLGSGVDTNFPAREIIIPPSQGILATVVSYAIAPPLNVHVPFVVKI